MSVRSRRSRPAAASAPRTAKAPESSPPRQTLLHVALVVADYDEAIDFYCGKLGFELVVDIDQPEQAKRWVLVAPPGGSGSSLLLARASTREQAAFVGDQTGGRVFLFLGTDDFWRDHARFLAAGVEFVREPTTETYGTVAVFRDLYGNLWDLIQLVESRRERGARSGGKPAVSPRSNATQGKAGRAATSRVVVRNVNWPGRTSRVDAAKYEAMRTALLRALPARPPGLTQAEMFAAVKRHLPEALFPGGAKAGWWAKTVQLDLEARGLVRRSMEARPLRWHRVGGAPRDRAR